MATATKSRSTRKSTVKPADKALAAAVKKVATPAKTAKRVTVKSTPKPAAKAPVKKSTRQTREKDSITATVIRGKRNWKTREIDTDWMPAKDGGVRFEEETDNGRSPYFMTQEDFADLGHPVKGRVTFKALA